MIKFELQNLILASIVSVTALAFILVHTRLTRKTYAGFDLWIAGMVFWLIGAMLVYELRGHVHPLLSDVYGNALILLHPIIFFEGQIRFYGLGSRWWRMPLNLALLAVAVLLFDNYTFTHDDIRARVLTVSALSVFFYGRIAFEPLLYRNIRRKDMQWLLSSFLLPLLLLYIIRCHNYLQHYDVKSFSDLIANDGSLAVIAIYLNFIYAMMAYSCISLTSNRVEEELHVSEERFKRLSDESKTSCGSLTRSSVLPMSMLLMPGCAAFAPMRCWDVQSLTS